jgi:NAD-dependent deacetylase
MKIVVLTGAGISAESGIKTFRDSDGFWENYNIEDVASLKGWAKNPALVLDFCNQLRQQILSVRPNLGHLALVQLEKKHEVCIITQNIDPLHEKAGSSHVIHLHGELMKARSSVNENYVVPWTKDILLGDKCPDGYQLRPHIVWFGEAVPLIEEAAYYVEAADYVLVIGSSMQVYPAAGLVSHAKKGVPVVYIDPKPVINHELKRSTLEIIAEPATIGVPMVVERLM